jgi:hypothetical protein
MTAARFAAWVSTTVYQTVNHTGLVITPYSHLLLLQLLPLILPLPAGEVTTPWPCFMMASRRNWVDEHLMAVRAVLEGISAACARFRQLPEPAAVAHISREFGNTEVDAR